MRKTIPEKLIVTCDGCWSHIPPKLAKANLQIVLRGETLENGVPVGPAYMSGTAYDLCADCYHQVTKIIGRDK